jgi:hypothetical protein
MPQLTVLLVRSGETAADVKAVSRDRGRLRLHERVDPTLTLQGYQQAQQVYAALITALCDQTPIVSRRGDSDGDGVIDPLRNLACFTAPLRACQSTALLLSAAGMASQDKLTWRYTTVEAATSPSAVPIITVNGLCASQAEIIECGGVDRVVNAGLLHTAAAPWNDARVKCPFMNVCVNDMKHTAGDMVKAYKADRNANPPNRVLEVQYLWLSPQVNNSTDSNTPTTQTVSNNTTVNNPWSLAELTPKVNVCIDMLKVSKYLTPPRKGNLDCKLPSSEKTESTSPDAMVVAAICDCVSKARLVGCDTVLFCLPGTAMQSMLQYVQGGRGRSGSAYQSGANTMTPCTVVTLMANVSDGNATTTSSCDIDWSLVGTFGLPQMVTNAAAAVPLWPGAVDCLVPPPPDKDPASVPANQWSAFPPPEPEVIPNDYPDLYVVYKMQWEHPCVCSTIRMPNSHTFSDCADHRLARPCRLHFLLSKPWVPFRAVAEAAAAVVALHQHVLLDEEREVVVVVVVARHHRIEVMVHRPVPVVVVVAPPVLSPLDVVRRGNLRRDQWRLPLAKRMCCVPYPYTLLLCAHEWRVCNAYR